MATGCFGSHKKKYSLEGVSEKNYSRPQEMKIVKSSIFIYIYTNSLFCWSTFILTFRLNHLKYMQYAAVKRVGHKKSVVWITATSVISPLPVSVIALLNTFWCLTPAMTLNRSLCIVGQYFDKTQKFPIEFISKLPFKIPIPIYRGCGLSELVLNMLWLG